MQKHKPERKLVYQPDPVEEYIRSIRWADDTPEYEKGLVAANIRAYHAHLRRTGELKGRSRWTRR